MSKFLSFRKLTNNLKEKYTPLPHKFSPTTTPEQTYLFTRINTNNKAHVQSVQSSVFPGQICSILVNILHRNRLFSSSFFVWKYFLSFLFFSPPFFVFRVLPLAPSQPVQILLTRIDLVAAAWLLQKEKLLFSISVSLSLSNPPSLSLSLTRFLSLTLSISVSVSLSPPLPPLCLSVCLSLSLPFSLPLSPASLSVCLSVCLSLSPASLSLSTPSLFFALLDGSWGRRFLPPPHSPRVYSHREGGIKPPRLITPALTRKVCN